MFTIITSEPAGRRLPFFLCPGGRLSCRRAEGVSFAVLRISNPRRINWRRIVRRLGSSSQRVLLGAGIQPPPGGSVQTVDVRRYSHMLARNGLRRLLEQNRHRLQAGTAVLIDLQGKHWDFSDLLLPFFRTVRIVTGREEQYCRYAAARMEDCGAAVLVGSRLSGPADLYVSPDGVFFPAMETGRVPVIVTAEPETELQAPVYSAFQADTPADLRLAPADVDPHAFQAALLEHCGLGRLAGLLPSRVKRGGQTLSLEEAAESLWGQSDASWDEK